MVKNKKSALGCKVEKCKFSKKELNSALSEWFWVNVIRTIGTVLFFFATLVCVITAVGFIIGSREAFADDGWQSLLRCCGTVVFAFAGYKCFQCVRKLTN